MLSRRLSRSESTKNMGIVEQFGIEPLLLASQVFNFLVLLYILKRFLYKPVLEILKKREEKIKQGLHDAALAQKRLEEAAKKEQEILAKANKQAREFLDEAKKRVGSFEEEARSRMKT